MKKTLRTTLSLFLTVIMLTYTLTTGVFAGRECDYHEGRNAVVYDVTEGGGKVYCFAEQDKYIDGVHRDERLYFCTNSDHGVFNPSYIGNCVLEADICALSADAYMNKWAYDGFITFNMAESKIGVGGINISLNTPWNVGEWHHVAVYSIYGSIGSVMAVDGVLVADNSSCVLGADAVVGRFWCVGCHNIAIDNIAVYIGAGANLARGEQIYFEDFEDGLWQMANPELGVPGDSPNGGGYIVDNGGAAGTTHYEHDLGEWYWFWDPSNQYAHLYGLNNNYAKWEFDVKVPAGTVDSRSYYNYDPVFSTSTIGVGSTALPYTWDGDWHHVVMDGEDGTGTTIWVDGIRIGKVATAIKAYWAGKPGDKVGIDNLKITGNGNNYFEDFEDSNFGGVSSDSNGYAAKYSIPHPHDAVAVTAPTCTEQGYTTHTCSICGDSYIDDYTDALGHSYGAWTIITAPTDNAPGQRRRTCVRCGNVEEEQISALTGPVMTVESVNVSDETEVTLSVRLKNNPGIYSQNFVIYYPNVLTLTDAAVSGDVYPVSEAYSSALGVDPSANPTFAKYFAHAGISTDNVRAIVWGVDNGSGFFNSSANGKILDLTFELPAGVTDAEYDIGIFGVYAPSYDAVTGTSESLGEAVIYVGGKITVSEQTLLPGDVNGDGLVTVQDLILMKKYIVSKVGDDDIVFANSELTGDGIITTQDVIALKRLLVSA